MKKHLSSLLVMGLLCLAPDLMAEWHSQQQDIMGTRISVRFWLDDKARAEAPGLLHQPLAKTLVGIELVEQVLERRAFGEFWKRHAVAAIQPPRGADIDHRR